MEIVLTIAGSDPSGGAGIQQDLRTIESLGCYGASVITALTTQNTLGVQSVMPVPADVVRSQLEAVLSDLDETDRAGRFSKRVRLRLAVYLASGRSEEHVPL